jgi:hypothetical protein
LRALGASWRLHSDADLERSRIDILAVFSVDLRDILEYVPVDCADLIALWDVNADDADNLEVASIHVEAVHGLTHGYDFRALIRVIQPQHESLLAAVIAVLKQYYGNYGLWRHEARRRAAELASARLPVNWDELRAS